MPPRRRIFETHYGSAKGEQAKGGGPLPPPMTGPPVPLSVQTPQAQGQTPMPQAQGQTPTLGAEPGQMPEGIEELLQQLLARFGGSRA